MKQGDGCESLPRDELAQDLAQLNADQVRCINWSGGPALVLAGPGSGKTRVITCRLAKIIRDSPDSRFKVMGLTFTNKAAGEMKDRIARYIPDDLDRVFVDTFHSFAAFLLRSHGTAIGIRPDFAICSPTEAFACYIEALQSVGVSSPGHSQTWKELVEISKLKSRLVPPENVTQVLGVGSWPSRIAVRYAAYEQALASSNRLDFDSLILQAHRLLQSATIIADHYRTSYPLVSIDEFQDTDYAQYALLGYLGTRQPRSVFAVADEDQLIYSWRGASTTRLRQYGDDYAPTVIALPMNYRCPSEVVTIADRLMRASPSRASDRSTQASARAPRAVSPVRVFGPLVDEDAEAEFILMDLRRRSVPSDQTVAILASRWTVLECVARVLRAAQVPCAALARREEFQTAPFVWLVHALTSALDPPNASKFRACLTALGRLTGEPTRIPNRASSASSELLAGWARAKVARDPTSLSGRAAALFNTDSITDLSFLRICDEAIALFETPDFQAAISRVNQPSDYQVDRKVWRAIVRDILQLHGRDIDLMTFLQELQLHSKEPIPDPGTVVLLTIHGAKGREFDHVYVAGLAEGLLPFSTEPGASDGAERLEEARRSCYVAITRAIDSLTLTFASSYGGRSSAASRFLTEMGLSRNAVR